MSDTREIIETDVWTPGEPVWRTGRKLGRTIYRFGKVVGIVDNRAMANELVAAANAARVSKSIRRFESVTKECDPDCSYCSEWREEMRSAK